MDAIEQARQESLERMKETVKAEVASLCEIARAKNKWLHCHYQDLWFTPDELLEQNANGRFIWGARNWSISDPEEGIHKLDNEVLHAQRRLDNLRDRVKKWEEGDRG